jgi:signal transduction histidine kinase
VLLVGLVYLLFGVAWFEVERARGLYRFSRASLRMRTAERPGSAGWLRSLWGQCLDGGMWAALVSFTVGSLFGLIVLQLLMVAAWNLAIMAGPLRLLGVFSSLWVDSSLTGALSSPWWSLAAAVLALAAVVGLAALHAVIVRGLLGSPSRGDLAAEARASSAQREGAVRAADVERTRIERDLHDGVQPRLVSIGMTLGLAQQKIDEDPQAARALIAEAHTSTKAAITELRQLARGIHASVLDDRGLDAALSALAARSHVPVSLDVRMEGRPARSSGAFRDAEAAVYFSVAEALTNAAKHSRATKCTVSVRLREPGSQAATLWARIEDNGVGGATVQPGGGLDGICNRVLAAGGDIRIDSPQGGPTAMEVSVPCAF